ncbi:MAG: RHS repeat-associated core domain-containing protein, partial [Candidatus Hydrogenedentes bacterium]|nr:RHS repeat-associated core domain-containing protein [Candidatus Hydrogenedentota bacterium]
YDEWGRMTSKSINGSYSATYAYRYGDKLCSVTSDFPNEGTVTYEYGGDHKRRSRSVSGGAYTWYNWDIGWNVINEENSIGSLAMTYAMDNPNAQVAAILSDVAGTNPSASTYRYYAHDHLGSTRALRAQDKSSLGAYEYTPYGQEYAQSGVAMSALGGSYTGKPWDATAQLYYFPYRYYSPDAARWLTGDPLGMVDGPNVYAYTRCDPIRRVDRYGHQSVPYPTPDGDMHWPDIDLDEEDLEEFLTFLENTLRTAGYIACVASAMSGFVVSELTLGISCMVANMVCFAVDALLGPAAGSACFTSVGGSCAAMQAREIALFRGAMARCRCILEGGTLFGGTLLGGLL